MIKIKFNKKTYKLHASEFSKTVFSNKLNMMIDVYNSTAYRKVFIINTKTQKCISVYTFDEIIEKAGD